MRKNVFLKSAITVFVLTLSSITVTPVAANAAPNGSCNTSEFTSGNGSSGSPFFVVDATDLAEVADCGQFGYTYSQIANIVLTGTWQNETGFIGNYYGNSYSITGLFIDGAIGGIPSRGLFPSISDSYFNGVFLSGTIVNAVSNTGLLAGLASHSSISGVTVFTDISVNESRYNNSYSIGGIVGAAYNNCDISGSSVIPLSPDASIDGDGLIGGLAGDTTDTIVVNSSSSINVNLRTDQTPEDSTWDAHAGGLVGFANWSGEPIYESYSYSTNFATGNVTCEIATRNCGGLVGWTNQIIHHSYATGNVSGGTAVGGLVGQSTNQIYLSHATGNVSGQMFIGGLVGESSNFHTDGIKIYDSYSLSDVSASYGFAGGLIGRWMPPVSSSAQIARVAAFGDVSTIDGVGGLIGVVEIESSSMRISDAFAMGNLSFDYGHGGGIIGDFRFIDASQFTADHLYFGGTFNNKEYDGFMKLNLNIPSRDGLTYNFEEIYWPKDSQNIKSDWLPNTNALPKTLFKRYTTFEFWDLDEIWKLDLDSNDGYLSLRGVGTSSAVMAAVPECVKVNLSAINFKKNSIGLTRSTRSVLNLNANKIINSNCSSVEIFGYASKDEPKKKQKSLATRRAKVVADYVRKQMESSEVYLQVIPVGKGVIKKGKVAKNRKATATIIN